MSVALLGPDAPLECQSLRAASRQGLGVLLHGRALMALSLAALGKEIIHQTLAGKCKKDFIQDFGNSGERLNSSPEITGSSGDSYPMGRRGWEWRIRERRLVRVGVGDSLLRQLSRPRMWPR